MRYLVSFKGFKLLSVEAWLNDVTGLYWETHLYFCSQRGCSTGITVSANVSSNSEEPTLAVGRQEVSLHRIPQPALGELLHVLQRAGLWCNFIWTDVCSFSVMWGHADLPMGQPKGPGWLLACHPNLPVSIVSFSRLHFLVGQQREPKHSFQTVAFAFLPAQAGYNQ